MLEVRKVEAGTIVYTQVEALLDEAIPEMERSSMEGFYAATTREEVDFLAYYEGDTFCGFSYTVCVGECAYLTTLATEAHLRSQHYGSQIIAYLRKKFAGKVIITDVEQLDPKAANYEQRKRRYAFYLRNGFLETDYVCKYKGGSYAILVSTDECTVERCQPLIEAVSPYVGLRGMRNEE